MSQHRRHYLDLNPPPGAWADSFAPAPKRREPKQAPDWVLVALALLLVAIQLLATIFPELDRPVLPPQASAFETHSPSVEDARIEGFRAGHATATEHGCEAAALTAPIR